MRNIQNPGRTCGADPDCAGRTMCATRSGRKSLLTTDPTQKSIFISVNPGNVVFCMELLRAMMSNSHTPAPGYAELLHRHISNRSPVGAVLDVFNRVESGKMLSEIYNLIIEKYDYSPHEAFTEVYTVEELYALSYTETYLRNPTDKNRSKRDQFYREIGYQLEIQLTKSV